MTPEESKSRAHELWNKAVLATYRQGEKSMLGDETECAYAGRKPGHDLRCALGQLAGSRRTALRWDQIGLSGEDVFRRVAPWEVFMRYKDAFGQLQGAHDNAYPRPELSWADDFWEKAAAVAAEHDLAMPEKPEPADD